MSFTCYRDAWGIPHLRAPDANALAFAQGWNAAVDRSWQIETARRRATGTASALLGGEWIGWDRLVRQARAVDTAAAAFDALDADTADWVRAFVAGVNAGLEQGAALAPESARGVAAPAAGSADGASAFGAAAASRPWESREPWEPWTPLAIWHAEHLLFGSGFPAKLWRERVRHLLGEEAVDRFALDGPEPVGSNGWLLDGAMTASGAPLLAGDPHRFIQLPGSYQQIRLACDEFDIVGLAMPGIPGIAHFGHTGGVAWGITNAMADTQDLYRERLRRGRDGSVEALGPDGWEPAFRRVERFQVAGGEEETVEVIETARGPIIAGGPGGPGERSESDGLERSEDAPDPEAPEAHAPRPGRRAVGRHPEAPEGTEGACSALSLRGPVQALPDLGFAALPRLLRASTVTDVDAALQDWVLPVNVVMAADTEGGLLHRTAGRVPERDAANVRYPVPAWDPRYAWRGWKRMPRRQVDRLAVMANDRGLAAPLGVEFCPPHRADRIRSLLEARSDWSAADMAAIHTDTRLPAAEAVLGLLPGLELGGEAASLRKSLLAWDRMMDSGSTEAAAFAAVRAAFVRHLAALPQFRALDAPSELPQVFAPWLALRPRTGYALEHVLAAAGSSDRVAEPESGTRSDGQDAVRRAGRGTAQQSGSGPADGVAAPEESSRSGGQGAVRDARGPADRDAAPRDAYGRGAVPRDADDRAAAPPFGIDPADRDTALRRAVEAVAAEPATTWGEVHRLVPWQDLPPGAEEPEPLTGMAGDADCVLSTSGVPGVTEDFARGPAARWVWDLADRRRSRWIVPFGASGAPGPHHRDQFPLWRRGELAPVVTDWHLLREEHRMIDRPAVFAQDLEGFGVVAVVPVRPAEDLDLIYDWVTQDRARFWGMTGHSRDHVREIYEYLDALSTHHAFLLLRDGAPIALFQTYEPDADPVGERYEVEPGDIGAHLLVAAPEGRAQVGFTGRLMQVLTAYLFEDPKHRRIVVEPDARNDQARARIRRLGFTLGPEIRLPDKTARLAFLRREDALGESA